MCTESYGWKNFYSQTTFLKSQIKGILLYWASTSLPTQHTFDNDYGNPSSSWASRMTKNTYKVHLNLVHFGCKEYFALQEIISAMEGNSFRFFSNDILKWWLIHSSFNLMRTGPLMNTILAEHNFNTYFQQIRIVPQ